ncbi:hypothetical protein Z043_123345 [Scleropages formosus]|uniref:Si:dkey-19b23.12 n=1 Tax=Scleropages formosus TaxID=113540 RepID=A0A0P7TM77_SCLFO|nr:hypothetical protein Z043_123345 [Scleropages formosus]
MENRRLLQNIPHPKKPSTPVLVISKLIVIALPIAQIAIGALYLKECPLKDYIPIYLVVWGVFSITLSLLSCLPCTQESEGQEQRPLSSLCTAWNSLVSIFLFCWFIAGNVWIYSIYPPNYDGSNGAPYCNKTLYLFAFWTTTLVYILVGAALVVCCCVLLCMCLLGRGGPGATYDEDV